MFCDRSLGMRNDLIRPWSQAVATVNNRGLDIHVEPYKSHNYIHVTYDWILGKLGYGWIVYVCLTKI